MTNDEGAFGSLEPQDDMRGVHNAHHFRSERPVRASVRQREA
jgi:hypothetical protein